MQRSDRAASLAEIAEALARNDAATADAFAARYFEWTLAVTNRAGITKRQALQVFFRDKFIDRYSGSRLMCPGALLAIGRLMPQRFPIHPTWKAGHSHETFWELWPVVDHIQPVSRGGTNTEENYVTTSVLNNSAKGNALLSELGWTLASPPANDERWDGLMAWFRKIVARNPGLLADSQVKAWHGAIRNIAF
jgi:hypothetical protein